MNSLYSLTLLNKERMSTKFKTSDIMSVFDNKDIPIVSVGSGMGTREQGMERTICVDPYEGDADRWMPLKRTRNPDYKTVRALISDKPNIIGNCYLLIEYPQTDYITYDYLAIHDLQPIKVVILTTSTSGSGGMILHMWLRQNGINTTNKINTEIQHEMFTLKSVAYYDCKIVKSLKANNQRFIFVVGQRQTDVVKRGILSSSTQEEMGTNGLHKTIAVLNILRSLE